VALLHFTKHPAGFLLLATPETTKFIQTRIKAGDIVTSEFKRVRNPAFHRRFFALLNLGFDYWEPTGGAISSAERTIVANYSRWLAAHGADAAVMTETAETYLNQLAERRAGAISVCKSFDAFRAWTTTEAGFYDVIALTDGSCRHVPRSISFARMDDTEFHEFYRAAFDVLWRWILSRTFGTREDAENAAGQLMTFAG